MGEQVQPGPAHHWRAPAWWLRGQWRRPRRTDAAVLASGTVERRVGKAAGAARWSRAWRSDGAVDKAETVKAKHLENFF
jgi:hypothetical protein